MCASVDSIRREMSRHGNLISCVRDSVVLGRSEMSACRCDTGRLSPMRKQKANGMRLVTEGRDAEACAPRSRPAARLLPKYQGKMGG